MELSYRYMSVIGHRLGPEGGRSDNYKLITKPFKLLIRFSAAIDMLMGLSI